jgi:hypothetical protein
VFQFLQEVYVSHGFLRGRPVDLRVSQVRQNTLQCQFSSLVRVLDCFQLKHVFLVQHIDSFISSFKGGLRSQQLNFSFLLDCFYSCGFHANFSGFLLGFVFFYCGDFFLLHDKSSLFLCI